MAFDYATVQGGIVTAITLGAVSIPASVPPNLYVDITTYSPQPSVGYYYEELCGVFSPAPIPPPRGAPPPWPPGGRGPAPPPVTNPGPTPPPIEIPVLVPFHADVNTPVTVTNIPITRTGLDPRHWTRYDFTRMSHARAQVYVATTGPDNSHARSRTPGRARRA